MDAEKHRERHDRIAPDGRVVRVAVIAPLKEGWRVAPAAVEPVPVVDDDAWPVIDSE